jgi:hypothetical protein
MKPFIRPKTEKEKKKKQDGEPINPGPVKPIPKTESDLIEHNVIVGDRDLDYTELENVEKILTKYKNSHTNRRNFDQKEQVEV